MAAKTGDKPQVWWYKLQKLLSRLALLRDVTVTDDSTDDQTTETSLRKSL